MIAYRAALILSGAASLCALALPAQAQIADDVVLNIMRECARIDDPTARLGCYDNNIRNAGPARNTVPGQVRAQGGGAVLNPRGATVGDFGAEDIRGNSGPAVAAASGNGVTGFGREDVRTPDRFNAAPPGEQSAITARVASVEQRAPGMYSLTLEDGAVWTFTGSVDSSYRVPEGGSSVEISRAAIGSFLMRYDNQASVRVRRVR
jgi:hypothetical protein